MVGAGALEWPGVPLDRIDPLPADDEWARLPLVPIDATRGAGAPRRERTGGRVTLPIMELMEQAVPARALWQLRRGATITPNSVTFTVWAPRAKDVAVHV